MGELEGIWQNKVTFEVTWVDPRLELQNLKHNDNLNILAREERDSVWFPNIIFGNTDAVERMVMDDKATLIVRREGSGTPSSMKNEIKSEIFKGEEEGSRTFFKRLDDVICGWFLNSLSLSLHGIKQF